MTMQQAYYRMVLKEYGLTDEAMRKMFFAANLVIEFKIDQLVEQLNPKEPVPPTLYFYNPTPSYEFILQNKINGYEIAVPTVLV